MEPIEQVTNIDDHERFKRCALLNFMHKLINGEIPSDGGK
jgi:hypothetical protein